MTDDQPGPRFTANLRRELDRRVQRDRARLGAPAMGLRSPRAMTRALVPIVVALVLIVGSVAAIRTGQHLQDEHPAKSMDAGAVPRLVTLPANIFDGLTGVRVPPGKISINTHGCITVGGAVLQAPSGSALSSDRTRVRLSAIGDFAIGETLPAVYGYPGTFALDRLPSWAAGCGAGRYVTAFYAWGGTASPVQALPTGELVGGSSTAFGAELTVGGNGCARVGYNYFLAPTGSAIVDNGHAIRIAGYGTIRVGAFVPKWTGTGRSYSARELPAALQRCGPGRYLALPKLQRSPFEVFDTHGEHRLAIQPTTAAPTSTLLPSGVLGPINSCLAIGGRPILAPPGSTISSDGTTVTLAGIGTFHTGETVPALPGRVRTYTGRTIPAGIGECGAGDTIDFVEIAPAK